MRFVNPVDAGAKLMAETGARHRPRDVIAKLPLRLFGALRCRQARSARDTVRESQARPDARRWNVVEEVRVLEHELVQARLAHNPVVVRVHRIVRVVAGRPG